MNLSDQPAFPVPDTKHGNGEVIYGSPGMSTLTFAAIELCKGFIADHSYQDAAAHAIAQATELLRQLAELEAK